MARWRVLCHPPPHFSTQKLTQAWHAIVQANGSSGLKSALQRKIAHLENLIGIWMLSVCDTCPMHGRALCALKNSRKYPKSTWMGRIDQGCCNFIQWVPIALIRIEWGTVYCWRCNLLPLIIMSIDKHILYYRNMLIYPFLIILGINPTVNNSHIQLMVFE